MEYIPQNINNIPNEQNNTLIPSNLATSNPITENINSNNKIENNSLQQIKELFQNIIYKNNTNIKNLKELFIHMNSSDLRKLFCQIDTFSKGNISLNDLEQYLNKNNLHYDTETLNIFMRQCTANNKSYNCNNISYEDFLHFISYTNVDYNLNDQSVKYSEEINNNFVKLLSNEFDIINYISMSAKSIKKLEDFITYEVFIKISNGEKYISFRNMLNFLGSNIYEVEEIEELINRFDLNKDGKISYEEFREIFYPFQNNLNEEAFFSESAIAKINYNPTSDNENYDNNNDNEEHEEKIYNDQNFNKNNLNYNINNDNINNNAYSNNEENEDNEDENDDIDYGKMNYDNLNINIGNNLMYNNIDNDNFDNNVNNMEDNENNNMGNNIKKNIENCEIAKINNINYNELNSDDNSEEDINNNEDINIPETYQLSTNMKSPDYNQNDINYNINNEEDINTNTDYLTKKFTKTNEENNEINNNIEIQTPKKQLFSSSKNDDEDNKNIFYTEQEMNNINNFIKFIYSLALLEKKSENLRESLALCDDFNIKEIFYLFDNNKQSCISIDDFKLICKNFLAIFPNLEDINLVFKRYDLDKDENLNSNEFFNMLAPLNQQYFYIIKEKDKLNKVNQTLSLKSKEIIIEFFKTIIENEANIHKIKGELMSKEKFNCLDFWSCIMRYQNNGKQVLDKNGLYYFLDNFGCYLTKYELDIIFNKFTGGKNLLTYEQFCKEMVD